MKRVFTTFFRLLIVSLTCFVWMGSLQAAGDYPALTGKEVYQQYCMACHMVDGKGAEGAGSYPTLAENPKLVSPGYPIYVVLNGQGAMPWFNGVLADKEVAAVVAYIRTHFGNDYPGAVKTEEVASMRGPVPKE